MKKTVNILKRQDAIKELIQTHEVPDQQTLIQLMHTQYGINTNQAIVSRDLRALGVSKKQVRNKTLYALQETDASQEILRLAVVSIAHNDTLICIKTLPGLAAFVGDYLDLQENSGILGTLAGENCLFVTPEKTDKITELYNALCTLLHIQTPTKLK